MDLSQYTLEPFCEDQDFTLYRGWHPSETALETTRLQCCIDDLIGLLALPAACRGLAPPEILSTVADSLMAMLALDFFFTRVILRSRRGAT